MHFLATLLALLSSANMDCYQNPRSDNKTTFCLDSTRTRFLLTDGQPNSLKCSYGVSDSLRGARITKIKGNQKFAKFRILIPLVITSEHLRLGDSTNWEPVAFETNCPPIEVAFKEMPYDTAKRIQSEKQLDKLTTASALRLGVGLGGGLLVGTLTHSAPAGLIAGVIGSTAAPVIYWSSKNRPAPAIGSLLGSVVGAGLASAAIANLQGGGCDGLGCMGGGGVEYLVAGVILLVAEPVGARIGIALEPAAIPKGAGVTARF